MASQRHISLSGPTLLCSGRRWRGPWAGRELLAWWRAVSRAGLERSPAAPLKAGVGPLNQTQVLFKLVISKGSLRVEDCYDKIGSCGVVFVIYSRRKIMDFFIPDTDRSDWERYYDAIRSFAKTTLGWDVSSRRIYRITYRHSGKTYTAEVGQLADVVNEKIFAILESNAYLVCTPNRGVFRDMPVLVGQNEIIDIVDFI